MWDEDVVGGCFHRPYQPQLLETRNERRRSSSAPSPEDDRESRALSRGPAARRYRRRDVRRANKHESRRHIERIEVTHPTSVTD